MNIYNDHYVYAYVRKSNNIPYYIGKGRGYRAFVKHIGISVPKDRSKILFLEKNLTEIGALALERRYIRWYGKKIDGGYLLNKTDGGDGVSGFKHSIKTKTKMSESKKGRIPHNKGKTLRTREEQRLYENEKNRSRYIKKGRRRGPCSEETKLKIRETKLKNKNWMSGRCWITNGIENKIVLKEQCHLYDRFILGRTC